MEPLIAGALLFCNPGQPGPYPPADVVVDAWIAAYNSGDAQTAASLISADALVEWGGEEIDGDTLVKAFRDRIFVRRPLGRVEASDRDTAPDNTIMETDSFTRSGEAPRKTLTFYRVQGGCIVSLSSATITD